jgi:hypothetical protein
VVKTRFSHSATELITVTIRTLFKRNDEVELASTHLTRAASNHSRMRFTFRYTHTAFMRMRRKVFNVPEQFMDRLDSRDFLIVAIRARMIVGPRDHRVVRIVANIARRIRILML